MIVDNELEKRTDWESKVGPDIGGPIPFIPPDFYGTTLAQDARQFTIRGKPYTDWLAALHRPLLPNTGYLTMSFDVMTDVNAWVAAQAIEFDTRVSVGGWDFNHSFQNNYQKGGMLQISNQVNVVDGKVTGGDWVDTGFQFGKFTPRQWYTIRLHYMFDVTKQVYRTERIDINGEWFSLGLPVLQAAKLGWTDGAHCQIQQDLSAAGGFFSIYVRNMAYYWL